MKRNKLDAILILAAGHRVYDDSFNLEEPFLNIGNSLIIDRIKKYTSNKNQIYIAVNNFPENYKNLNAFENCFFIDVGNTIGAIETIKKSINKIPEEFINIIPITTIPDSDFEAKNRIYFGNKKLSKENWSAISYENQSIKFHFKKENISFKKKCYPFTGRISSEKMLIKEAFNHLNKNQTEDLLFLAKVLIEINDFKIIHEKWYDSGHSTTYFETKIISFSSRFFNEVSFNENNNSIIKKSKDKSKLIKEKDFYTQIPTKLKHYFPIIINSKKELNDSLELEYLPFPNLSEIFLFRQLESNRWEKVVNSIYKIYNAFYRNQSFIYENASFLYTKKLNSRISNLYELSFKKNNSLLIKIINGSISINGRSLPSLKKTIDEITYKLSNFEKKRPLCFGHGDLCFNNILLEPLSCSIKLIDPKAEVIKNKKLGYVDPLYDLAKLNHSFSCLYDSVVNNLFYLSLKKDDCILKIIKPKNYDISNYYFRNLFFNNSEVDENLLRILTSNLFLSMSPLHQDDVNKMCTFLIIGISLFYDIKLDTYMLEK